MENNITISALPEGETNYLSYSSNLAYDDDIYDNYLSSNYETGIPRESSYSGNEGYNGNSNNNSHNGSDIHFHIPVSSEPAGNYITEKFMKKSTIHAQSLGKLGIRDMNNGMGGDDEIRGYGIDPNSREDYIQPHRIQNNTYIQAHIQNQNQPQSQLQEVKAESYNREEVGESFDITRMGLNPHLTKKPNISLPRNPHVRGDFEYQDQNHLQIQHQTHTQHQSQPVNTILEKEFNNDQVKTKVQNIVFPTNGNNIYNCPLCNDIARSRCLCKLQSCSCINGHNWFINDNGMRQLGQINH